MTPRQRFDQATDRVDQLEHQIESSLGRFGKFADIRSELSDGRWKQATLDDDFRDKSPDADALMSLITEWREAKKQSLELYPLLSPSEKNRIIPPK